MPRYLVETTPRTADLAGLLHLLRTRFPEVALERRFAHGGDGAGDTWVCRATSDALVASWAHAAGLAVASVHAIRSDDDLTPARADAARRDTRSSP